jgi:hypothetical protein
MSSTRSASLTRGLARVETGVGTLISYSTEPGNVALDGTGRNSPFTKALLANIETKGVSINDLMITVRKQVLTSTNGKQVPWENSSLTGQFYFNPDDSKTAGTKNETIKTAALNPAQSRTPAVRREVMVVADSTLEHTFWVSIKDSNDKLQFQAYLDKFPKGIFAYLAKAKIDALSKSRAIQVEERNTIVTNQPKNTQLALANTNDQPTTTQPKITTPTLDPQQVAWQMQTQLKRVGCYLSRIDGDWGTGSSRAWSNFKRYARMRDLPNQPDASMIPVVKDFTARVCPAPRRTVRRTRGRHHPAPRHRERRHNNDAAGAALIGGLIGLGIGLSIRRR